MEYVCLYNSHMATYVYILLYIHISVCMPIFTYMYIYYIYICEYMPRYSDSLKLLDKYVYYLMWFVGGSTSLLSRLPIHVATETLFNKLSSLNALPIPLLRQVSPSLFLNVFCVFVFSLVSRLCFVVLIVPFRFYLGRCTGLCDPISVGTSVVGWCWLLCT